MMTNNYQLIAKLKGHKNDDPPSICFIPHSNCLVTAEKYYEVDKLVNNEEPIQGDDPTAAPSYITQNSKAGSYEKFATRKKTNDQKCEIIIWNLQRDMIELYSRRPPWNV